MKIGFIQKRKYAKEGPEAGLSKLCSTSIAVSLQANIFTPKIKPKTFHDFFINWGVTNIPYLGLIEQKIINHPLAIKRAANKLVSFLAFNTYGITIPEFTESIETARSWFDQEDTVVFCRCKLSSFQGKGIVIAKTKEELVSAPLYTRRIKKRWEFRVHVAFGKAIYTQQKKRLSKEKLAERGISEESTLIRSWNNGYIFSTLTTDPYPLIRDTLELEAIAAVKCLGLDFGAVDLIVTRNNKVYVLEVNTAPGIEGKTVERYVEAFSNEIQERYDVSFPSENN